MELSKKVVGMSEPPMLVELKYGVSAFLVTCGIALMGLSAVNAVTFTPGASLLFLGILGFIANRLVWEATDRHWAANEEGLLSLIVPVGRMVLMVVAAIMVVFLFRPLLAI